MSFLPYDTAGPTSWIAAGGASALAHAALVFAALGGLAQILDLSEQPPPRPNFVVTLEQLQSDTLAGMIAQEGVAGAEGDHSATEQNVGETPPAPDIENPQPEQPEIPPDMVPETPPPVPAETVAAVPVETAVALPPLDPIDAGPIMGEILSPIAPDAGAPVSTTPMMPVDSLTETLPLLQQALPIVAMLPASAPAPSPPPQTAQDLAIGDLIQRIRTALADPCLLALPRRDGTDGIGLAMIAANDTAMAQFANTALTSEDSALRQTRTLVDPRQCPALTYVRQNRDYPATRLGLQLDAAEVPSGGRLTGVLRGTAGRYLLLVLVDNNGVVQDLQRFVSFSGNFARFDIPVTRAGDARDTSQILLAIATQRPANTLRDRAGQLAQDVFASLEGEVATSAALAIATFDVR